MGQPEASLSFAHFAKILILLFLLTPLTSFAHTNSAGRSGTGGGGGGGTGDITDVWGCATGNCNSITAASGDTLNATSATSSIPFTVNTTLPATCTVGQAHVKPDATAALKFFICTATNTWTEAAARIDFDTDLDGEIDTDKLAAPAGSPGQVVTIDGSNHLTLSSTLFSDAGGTVFSGSPLYVLDSPVSQFFQVDPDSSTPLTYFGLVADGEPTGIRYVILPVDNHPMTGERSGSMSLTVMFRTDYNSEVELENLMGDNIIVDGEIDTIAEIEAMAAAVNIITSLEIDTMAKLDTLIADANVLSEEELNTQAETEASTIKFLPRPDEAPLDGESVRYDPGLHPVHYTPVEDLASLGSRDNPNAYQIGMVIFESGTNPNGTVACSAGSGYAHVSYPTEVGRKYVLDTSTTPSQLWVCTTAGSSTTAVWSLLGPTRQDCTSIIDPGAGTDWVPIFIARRASKILSFGCFCGVNCGTPAQVTLKDDATDVIGSTATCGTTSVTWVDTSADVDATIAANEAVMADVSNTPTASGKYTYCLTYIEQ